MMKRIEEFNICSSTLDYDLVMNPTLREAVTLAVNYQLEEYESETGIELNPEELVLFFYPESRCKLMEIRKKNDKEELCLIDYIADWIDIVKDEARKGNRIAFS